MPTKLPDSRRTPRFAGLCTFCRLPPLSQAPPEHQAVDWAVYGVPFDGGVTYRPGARFGPRAVREQSQYIKPYHLALDVDVAARLSLADAGDAPVAPYSCRENVETVLAFARTVGDPVRTRLLAVGGDHSIAYANVRATYERVNGTVVQGEASSEPSGGKGSGAASGAAAGPRGAVEGGSASGDQVQPGAGLAMLHFDAHLDTVDAVWGERWGHASPFIRLIEEGIVDPRSMLSVGIRGPLNTAHDLEFARRHGVEVVTADQVASGEALAAVRAFVARIGSRPLYVSFDVDCLDPAFAPGTGTPVCGGLSTREAFALLRAAKGARLVGGDVVEVLPDRDVAGITALAASHVLLELLALAAVAPAGASA